MTHSENASNKHFSLVGLCATRTTKFCVCDTLLMRCTVYKSNVDRRTAQTLQRKIRRRGGNDREAGGKEKYKEEGDRQFMEEGRLAEITVVLQDGGEGHWASRLDCDGIKSQSASKPENYGSGRGAVFLEGGKIGMIAETRC